MKKRILALMLVIFATMFSFAMAETDQVSFSITVGQNTPDWANVQFPADTTVELGENCNFYAQVWEDGKTPGEGQYTSIDAWIGYNNSDVGSTDPGWTWLPATYNAAASSEATNSFANDEYYIELASSLPVGTYYVRSRFAFTGDSTNASYGLLGDTTSAVLRIIKINHAPVLAAIPAKTVEEDGSLSFTVSATDSDNDTLTYSIFSNDQSDDITVSISNDTLFIVPDADFFTSTDANVIIKVSDGHGGEDTTSFKLNIDAVNDAPIIAAVGSQNIAEGSELTVNFTATDVDNVGSELTWSQSGKPEGSVFTDNGDGTAKLVWTPNYTQAGNYNGIEISVDDGHASSRTLVIKTDTNLNR